MTPEGKDRALTVTSAIASLGGDVSKFVHPLVRARLAAKVASLGKA